MVSHFSALKYLLKYISDNLHMAVNLMDTPELCIEVTLVQGLNQSNNIHTNNKFL
jgi:hypothetical protein